MTPELKIFIGQLSSATGLSREALRFYEKEGILNSERLENNYRVYDHKSINRIQFVENAQTAGFSLREVREMLNLVENGHTSCTDYEGIAEKKLKELDTKIAALKKCRVVLAESLSCCKRDAGRCDSLASL